MKLNEKIYHYRKQAKLSQEELAARVGVSRQAVSKWELGTATPELDKLIALARAFGVTTDELLSPDEPEQGQPEDGPQSASAFRSSAYFYESQPGSTPPAGRHSFRFLERLARRWGWLAGVYIALSGLGGIAVGGLARFVFSRMFAFMMPGAMMGAGWQSAGDSFNPGQIFLTFANVIMIAGAVILIAGVILAVWLYRKGRRQS